MDAAIVAVHALREQSKEKLGYGYSIGWREIGSRKFGRNRFPERIVFETRGDFLRFLGRERDFAAYTEAVGAIRARFPAMEPWLRKHIAATCEIAETGIVAGLLDVCEFLVAHPRCGLFARELPVAVDTKFVERHRNRFLRPWLDILLPPGAIEADEAHFERRFGLGYPEPLVQIRLLDPALQSVFAVPANHFALPLGAAARLAPAPLPGGGELHVMMVENQVNFLTLPPLPRTVALLGFGCAASRLRDLHWIAPLRISYWGDIDAQGFEILSQFRTWFPRAESVLMDRETFDRFARFQVVGVPRRSEEPLHLTSAEQDLCDACIAGNLRLEQEKIPQSWVKRRLLLLFR